MRNCLSIFGVLFFLCVILPAQAVEIVVLNPDKSDGDARYTYPKIILERALQRTVEKYGPYEIRVFPEAVSRKRALKELVTGGISVFPVVTQKEWEDTAIPVFIPLIKGLLGYKLFLIREENQKDFDQVRTVEDLKKYRLGQGQQWSSTAALKRLGFTASGGTSYENLFNMLDKNRFDYFPRGVNEIFPEFSARKEQFPQMRIEKTIALYLPSPAYFFVSPTNPRLAARIEEGLLAMIDDGEFERHFNLFYQPILKQADLNSRRILHLENLNLSDKNRLGDRKLWLYFEGKKSLM